MRVWWITDAPDIKSDGQTLPDLSVVVTRVDRRHLTRG